MSARNAAPTSLGRRREVVLRFALPRLPACTAALGTGSLGAALIHGALPPAPVWPLVVLALGAMGSAPSPRRRPAADAARAVLGRTAVTWRAPARCSRWRETASPAVLAPTAGPRAG
ncbi:hypothetical protein [Streptomyces rochei]|uniref:hypothetical protein n=1 Tax=Streptomyces rochei TaxID=1928 RepID=UPI004064A523